MLIDKDEYLISDQNNLFELVLYSTTGNREEQQDRAGITITDDESLIVVCDGMGGSRGGRIASSYVVDTLLNDYFCRDKNANVAGFFVDEMHLIDKAIASFKDDNGDALKAGTTITAVNIRDKELNWISLGDSRIYICRGNELVQVTTDHTYEVVLHENKEAGLISEDFYDTESKYSEALISYLGANGLSLMDYNEQSLELHSGDKIVLMTDGLYKYVDLLQMREIIINCENLSDMILKLEDNVKQYVSMKSISRDNMTVAIIRIK